MSSGDYQGAQERPAGRAGVAPPLTQLEFSDRDIAEARLMAEALGYDQTAYTTHSALWGLFCLPSRPGQRRGCVIKTAELGLLFVQDAEDLGLEDPAVREGSTPPEKR